MKQILKLLAAIPALVLGATAALAQGEPNFAGKTVRIIIPSAVGGEYGLYSQLMANHLGKYVPGNPAVIVQAMPGGAGLIAVNWMFSVAPKDGTVLFIPPVNAI